MTIRPPSPPKSAPTLLLAGLLLAAGGSGCNYFRNLGSGTHMDATQAHVSTADHRTRVLVMVVTTDAQGQIANIQIKRSSGKEAIDNYVAQTIKDGWPPQPSTRTEVEVTYTGDNGFSQPKVLSTAPAA